MTSGPARVTECDLEAALWRLLAASDREDATAFLAELADAEAALATETEPPWPIWRHVFAARRALLEGEPQAASAAVTAARGALDACPSTAGTALAMAYLAHVEMTADRFDSAMLLAVDASLLTDSISAARPSRALLQTHFWLSRALTGLDLEELAVAHAQRGHGVALQLDDAGDRWRLLLLTAQQQAELAQTLRRRGEIARARDLALTAIDCAVAARSLDVEPAPVEQDLLDIVQSWALVCRDALDAALGPMRSAHRRVQAEGGIWLRGYADLALARLLARLSARDGDPPLGEQAIDLLVDASGAFAAAGDRRRYRHCLLELGQCTAELGRPGEALHWLEAYRADTGRAHARGRQLWAEMFVRGSRLREAERQAALLQQHALEDPLTGLGNRRSAERRLGSLHRGEAPVSLAVVDVDRFKEVNDLASHLSGDAVLRRVADLLREHSRTGDEVYRWAGDEFLVVLPTATEEQAVVVMDRLRAAVAGADWSDLPLTEPVTVSVGVARRLGSTPTPVARSAGGRCSTPPTCTCSPPSVADATGCGLRVACCQRGRRSAGLRVSGWDAWGATDERRRGSRPVLDTGEDDVHSALVPPGALHQRVTAALANWQLDDAEALLADVERVPSPYEPSETDSPADLGRAWADTLRAELLVRRLRVAGFTLVGDPLDPASEATPALDLHAGVAELLEGPGDDDPRAEQASRAALAIALVRSAKAAFDATDDGLQRAAGLARHARIELLSRRIDAAMDEAVEAASLLDPALPASGLLVDTLSTLAGVLADLELMPLALDYQRRAHETAIAAAAAPEALTADDGDPDVLVAAHATRLGELCAELGEGLLDDGAPESAAPHFAEARRMAEQALELLPPDEPGVVAAQVVHGWALVGLGEHAAAAGPLRAAVRITSATADRALLASARLALGRALRRQGDGRGADEHLTQALALASDHGLPRVRRAALRELCTLHSELDDAGRALPYLQAYIADELDRVDERRTRWVELFGRRKSLLETERAAGQLRRQAYEDPLTHLPNRRYAEARLDGLLSAGSMPALAVVDVDHFKSINDAVGHPGGDAVLRVVAELLVDGVRDTDEVCRWAGDEFVILLPDTTSEQAERALERTRRAIARYDWAEFGLARPVTISVGIASAARGDDRRTLFAAADGVLYDAKRSGRDRVVRLSAVTQTRAGSSPLDALFGPAPGGDTAAAAASGDDEPAATVADVQPAPLTPDDGFAPLLASAPATPPLGLGGPADPPLGPVTPVSAVRPVAVPAEPGPVPVRAVLPTTPPELVWATGRTTEQVLALVREARHEHPDRAALVLRATPETLVALASEHDAYTTMDAAATAAAVGPAPEPAGRVAVLCGAGADAPVAAEVAFVARVTGTEVVRVDDIAGSRLQPFLDDPALLADVDCVVVVAGLDASLAGLIAGATDVPVVAVPTSSGHTDAFGGLGALLTMLNTSSPGVVVTTVDQGWSAGVFAARLARRTAR